MARNTVLAGRPGAARIGGNGAANACAKQLPVGLLAFATPMLAQAANSAPAVLPAVAVVPVLAGVGVLLMAALLWSGHQLARQRARVQVLEQDARTRAADAQHTIEQLADAERRAAEAEQQLQQQAESFARLAHEDDLSGLPNRRAFDDALSRDMAAARRNERTLSLVVLSIDHLKQINTAWSRAVGDLVLCEVGELLRRSLRASDMPARLGNKEFAVLLADTSLVEAELVCQRLQRLFGQYGEWGGRGEGEIKVTFSAGAVEMGEGDVAPVLFYQRAKNALAQAKHDGRARTFAAA